MSRISSGSSRLDNSVEPTMSQKTTVRFRRSALTPRDPENDCSSLDNCDTSRPFASCQKNGFCGHFISSFCCNHRAFFCRLSSRIERSYFRRLFLPFLAAIPAGGLDPHPPAKGTQHLTD